MVHDDKAGSDRHQPVTQKVQPNPPQPDPQHTTASPGNPDQKWHGLEH
jgi:hypothetical protein